MKRLTMCCILVILLLTFGNACSKKPLLEDVTMTPQIISPNADATEDITKIEFTLNYNATVSITFIDEQNRVYVFRSPTRLSVSETPYSVFFAGVVDAFSFKEETTRDYEVIKRVLPDGRYTWSIHAETEDGNIATAQGELIIQDSDSVVPGINGLSVFPKTFSPNQDGIDDRTTINLTLTKDVEELKVFLVGDDGIEHQIGETEIVTEYKRGWYSYDYDGGIDTGSTPPPDGTYHLYATARDKLGQQTIASDTLTIHDAGLPRAYIVNAEVEYSTSSVVLSDSLCFTLTIENDSDTLIRTTGPWPGTTYQSSENYNAKNYAEESGAFRVGMDFDTSLRNYPFRWGIGRPGIELVQQGQYWYLPSRARSVVTGCVQIVDAPVRNPLYYWMGLIHEDVEIAPVNNRVDPHFVTIWVP